MPEDIVKNKNWKAGVKLDFLTISFVVASIALVLINFLQQQRQSKKSIEIRDEQIKQKNEIIEELKDIVTGGNSYIYIQPVQVAHTSQMSLHIAFSGNILFTTSLF